MTDYLEKRLEDLAGSFGSAGNMFITLLGACAYAWLTVAATTDTGLFANTASSKLPVINTDFPIVVFYWAAPALLFGSYFYFHLFLQLLWRPLAALPAVAPDGKRLDERDHPWFVNAFIRDRFPQLRKHKPELAWLQHALSVISAWMLVPLTLGLFWWRFLCCLDWFPNTFV